jgi:predicted metal-dependent phosphoesterase TrpH
MKIKTNLHFHTGDDDLDPITYSTKEGIDKAVELGFGALAITCHQKFAWTEEYAEYAKSKGLVFIPGIEIYIGETMSNAIRHLLILNATPKTEKIHTFEQLAQYKKEHPEVFIMAAHPYFYGNICLKEWLEKYIDLFDAVELSWFYSRWFNRNVKGKAVAEKYKLPFVATSDAHFFDFLDKNYCTVDAESATPEAIFAAIKTGKFENTTSPRNFWLDMVYRQGRFFARTYFWRKAGCPRPYNSRL